MHGYVYFDARCCSDLVGWNIGELTVSWLEDFILVRGSRGSLCEEIMASVHYTRRSFENCNGWGCNALFLELSLCILYSPKKREKRKKKVVSSQSSS